MDWPNCLSRAKLKSSRVPGIPTARWRAGTCGAASTARRESKGRRSYQLASDDRVVLAAEKRIVEIVRQSGQRGHRIDRGRPVENLDVPDPVFLQIERQQCMRDGPRVTGVEIELRREYGQALRIGGLDSDHAAAPQLLRREANHFRK